MHYIGLFHQPVGFAITGFDCAARTRYYQLDKFYALNLLVPNVLNAYWWEKPATKIVSYASQQSGSIHCESYLPEDRMKPLVAQITIGSLQQQGALRNNNTKAELVAWVPAKQRVDILHWAVANRALHEASGLKSNNYLLDVAENCNLN